MAVTQGSIAFVGINTNGTDWLAFVTLADLAAGDTIYFSDNELITAGSTSFNTGESYSKWVAPVAGVAAGTVVVINSFDTTPVATTGTASTLTFALSTNRGLSATAESVYAYTATGDATADTPVINLAHVFIGVPATPAADGVAPASLPASLDLSFTDGRDGALFTGSHADQFTFANYLTTLSNTANYSNPGATATLSSALNAAPFTLLPSLVTISDASISEGNAGTKLLSFTIARSNNAGAFSVDVATTDQSATAGTDYVTRTTTLTFSAGGALTQAFDVTINGDTTAEANETLLVNLTNAVASLGAVSLSDAQGVGTISNDDSVLSILSAGDVDRDSAVLLAKSSTTGVVTFQVATDAAFANIIATQASAAVTDALVPAKVVLADGALAAGTTYYWRATDALGATATASFRTADADGVRNGFSMGVTGDWRGELAPYPAIKNAATAGLDLFVKLGDTIYADYASPALNQPQAITLTDYLTKHNEVYSPKAGLDAWGDLQKTTAILATIDDHEVINDFAGGALASSDPRFGTTTGLVNDTALYENGLAAFTAYNAIENRTYADTGAAPRTDGEPNLYRYSQQGRDAAVYVLDARSFRDSELAPAASLTDPTAITNFLVAAANPTRTLLGAPQLAQLKADLLDAQAKGVIWKFIQLPEPIQNFGVLGAEDRYEGYSAERTDILKFINTNKLTGVVFVSADIHGSVTNNLTYQDAPGGPQIAVAAWEITTGSVAFDAPFGQTVGALAGAAGLLTPQQTAFYNSLPVAPDTDSTANDKDDFIKGVINQQVTALGYDPIGLNANLTQTNGLIDATLVSGDYLVTHGYGWTRFDVNATTGDLTVTTYGVPYYSAADAAADPAAIAALTPTIQAQFTVRATVDETINGTVAGETLDGGGGNDTISGLGGNDTITGGFGDDVIDGGAGLDIAVFQGNRAAATIVNTGLGSWTVTTANGGTDTLKNVEQLQFADGLYGGATLTANTGIDLSIYKLVGRYDLPEPTRTTAPANNLLAQEASAVTYDWDTDTLFVLGDGGTAIVQVSKTGALIDTMTLSPGGSPQGTDFYDPEGLTYVGGGKFVMTEERDRQLVQFTYAPGTVLHRADAQTVKLGTTIGNIGFEGVSYDPQSAGFIVVKEISPESIFQTTVDFAAGTASNGSPTATGSTNLFDPALLGLNDIADVFALSNLTALSGLAQSGNILVLSQEDGRIVNTDRAGNISSALNIVSNPGNPLSVANQQHEGLVVGADGTLYVVSENGGGDFDHPQLWVYKPSTVPNQAPTALALTNQTTSIAENTSTTTRIKVADVSITDDGIGTNSFTLTGADAAFFEVDANGLYIKAGTVLDFETKSAYAVTVNVDDTSVGATPDATASYSLTLSDIVNENPAQPVLFISEVAPWSSGNSPVAADWFEVTNAGSVAVDITGWRFDDNSNLFSAAVALSGITSIAAGESVIFLETANLATTSTTFINTWFGGTAPAGLRLGSYSGAGVGLSTGGDAVNLYNAAGLLQANVIFGASPAAAPFATFNNAAGQNNVTLTTLSAVGTNGAAAAVNDAAEIGSPGTVGKLFISEVAPWSSGNSPVAADWFEVTNTTAQAIDITGWKIDDNSGSPAAAVALTGVTSIGAGESVIFLETATLATTRASFIDTWFGGTAPANLKIGAYSGTGVGLGTGGDAVNLYDASSVLRASVSFGASPTGTFATFDNAAGLNNAAVTRLSATGSNGAFVAVADTAEIGSPGTITAIPLVAGSPGADTLFGGDGPETINGGAGDDVIYGGGGSDTMSGGAGNDTYVVDQAGDVVNEGGGAGFDTVFVTGSGWTAGPNIELFYIYGASSFTGSAGAETIVANASLGGTVDGGAGNDTIWGGTGGDSLLGGAGEDVIRGGAGNDTMAGGADNDVYVVDGAGDSVVEASGEGFDTVFVTASGWTAGPNIELLYLLGATSFTASASDETIVNTAAVAATIDGAGGNDTIWGSAGAETLSGGAGDDVIRGGDGNDVLIGGAGNDQLVGGAGADVFGFTAPGWGYDQIFDFVVGTDRINMAPTVATNFSQLTVYGAGGGTVVLLGADRIDVYGVTLTAGDFIFG